LKAVQEDTTPVSITTFRLALLVGLILYMQSGIIDYFITMERREIMAFIRLAIVSPVIAAGLILSYLPVFKRIVQPAISIVSMVVGLRIVAMIILDPEKTRTIYFYGGLCHRNNMDIHTGTAQVHKQPLPAGPSSSYTTRRSCTMVSCNSIETMKIFINNNIFLISVNRIGMFAHTDGILSRKDFCIACLSRLKKQENRIRKG
jgi:hypothetical protein